MSSAPPLARKLSAPWDRLRPVKQDPLESIGYVSKGDNRLLDRAAQETFYHKIVHRYMQFCADHSKNLDDAHKSLYRRENLPAPSDSRPLTAAPTSSAANDRSTAGVPAGSSPPPATELSIILQALRKLREGLQASASNAPSPVFAQRVHVFNIRLAILALQPESYHHPLLRLLLVLHTDEHPLPRSELVEMTTYIILDLATRQCDLGSAYALRYNSRIKFNYDSRTADTILRSIAASDWVSFWRVRRKVDGHVRAILHWQVERLRKSVLKAIGRTYLVCDIKWILASTSGNELSWEELVEMEQVGWTREGDKIIIRKPKSKC